MSCPKCNDSPRLNSLILVSPFHHHNYIVLLFGQLYVRHVVSARTQLAMPKLKISAVIPPLHQPANSLYPTVQTDKERRFLLTVKPASSVGSLYEEIYDKCKNAYLDGRQARLDARNIHCPNDPRLPL